MENQYNNERLICRRCLGIRRRTKREEKILKAEIKYNQIVTKRRHIINAIIELQLEENN